MERYNSANLLLLIGIYMTDYSVNTADIKNKNLVRLVWIIIAFLGGAACVVLWFLYGIAMNNIHQNDMDATSVQRASQTAPETPEARAAKNEIKEVDFKGQLAVDESKAIQTKAITAKFTSQASTTESAMALTGGSKGSVISGDVETPKTMNTPKLAVGMSIIQQARSQ